MRSTGQLEDLIGGAAIERCWREIQEKPADAKQAAKLRAPAIFDLARDGNEEAARILQQTATILGDTITNIALLLNPDLVVLGGGIGAHPELSKATEALLSRNEFANPRIRPSVLGTEAQLFGAVAISVAAAEAKLLA
jgi:glucokinase